MYVCMHPTIYLSILKMHQMLHTSLSLVSSGSLYYTPSVDYCSLWSRSVTLLISRVAVSKNKFVRALCKWTQTNKISQWKSCNFNIPPDAQIFSRGVYCFAVFTAWVGRNNILCISRDAVLTNQQLPSRYSSGVAKRLARNVWGKLNGNVWAESFKSGLCWFFTEFCAPRVALLLQLTRQWSPHTRAASAPLQQERGVHAPVDFSLKFVHAWTSGTTTEPRLWRLLSAVSVQPGLHKREHLQRPRQGAFGRVGAVLPGRKPQGGGGRQERRSLRGRARGRGWTRLLRCGQPVSRLCGPAWPGFGRSSSCERQ